MAQTVNIFPTPIFTYKLDEEDNNLIHKKIAEAIPKSKFGMPWPEAVKSTFQFEGDCNVIKKFNMELLETRIIQSAIAYMQSIPTKIIPELYIKDSWMNISKKNSQQNSHIHPLSLISGVYYYKTTGEEGDLVFENPNQIVDFMYNSGQIWPNEFAIKPTAGLLVLFPSWLRHYVDINNTDNDRIVLAFNLVPRGGPLSC
jgi:uncharacterized protein (TIGR02466 family)